MPSEAGHRLYVKGRHLSYQRGKRNTNPGTSLIKIEGVDDTKAANFYLGKKVAFVYRAQREVRGSKIRVIWGKVTRTHGNSGVVRAQFRHNLPPKSFGASVRVMLYPSSIQEGGLELDAWNGPFASILVTTMDHQREQSLAGSKMNKANTNHDIPVIMTGT